MAHKVLVAVPTAEMARNAVFYDHLAMMTRPEGTTQIMAHGQSPARNRNLMIEHALANDFTHILFIDDDVLVPPDLLERLLAHDKEIVSGLYLMRNFPHRAIAFDFTNDKGECRNIILGDGRQGLVEITNCGLGACLISTKVFKAMEKPWIRLGELEADHWCDDIGFFNRARMEFKLWLDLSAVCGHIASVTIAPIYIDGKWFTTYDSYGLMKLTIPQLTEQNVNELKGNSELVNV